MFASLRLEECSMFRAMCTHNMCMQEPWHTHLFLYKKVMGILAIFDSFKMDNIMKLLLSLAMSKK